LKYHAKGKIKKRNEPAFFGLCLSFNCYFFVTQVRKTAQSPPPGGSHRSTNRSEAELTEGKSVKTCAEPVEASV
jgi:hypothetical protein